MQNFSQNKNKLRNAYLLTPAGVAEKVNVMSKFFRLKVVEYDVLRVEIKLLRSEMDSSARNDVLRAFI